MNEIVNQLAQSLFKKNSLQECSRWELEILADHYPYFGIAQFLVTGKLKDERAEGYDRQLEKTSLYFTNPLWLDYVINNKEFPSAAIAASNEFTETENADIITFKTKEIITQEIIPPAQITIEAAEGVSQIEDEPIVRRENTPSPVVQPFSENDEPVSDPEPYSEEVIKDTDSIIENPEEELKMRPFKFEPLKDTNLKAPLAFEPYHTIDYFASQGIKMVQTEKPKDRFEQQLKSFTQWLKTIKTVPVTEIVKETGLDSEQKVITLAEHSIEDREIVTEAMAEVWTKQGNMEKAIEVYTKLSLQNPAKSSYFAGLIEQLKQQ
jgi:hypothetical protein